MVVLVYVYDLLIIEDSLKLIQQVRKDLQVRFKMKDLGELKFFLGIGFSRSEKGIQMCQRKYALELVSKLGLSGGKLVTTPLEVDHKLTSVEFDKVVNGDASGDDSTLEDKGSYKRIICRLLYLTMTRHDITFMVQVLSQFMHAPKQSHMNAVMRVIRYIKGTSGLGLFIPTSEGMILIGVLVWKLENQ